MIALPARTDLRVSPERFDEITEEIVAHYEHGDGPDHLRADYIKATRDFAKLWRGALTKPAQQQPERRAA